MSKLLLLFFLLTLPAFASIVGVTTHPLSDRARVLSAEMTGYMSQRNEMGAGVRYTQGFKRNLLDLTAGGAQSSRSMILGAGMDFEVLREDVNQPRVSVKPYIQQMNFDKNTMTLTGVAPTLRKGATVNGKEFFPYLSLPNGMKLDNNSQELVFYSSMTVGASMAMPRSQEKLVLSLEANKNLGASSDYVGALVSWIWN
ncbi:MAG: hypothetical protein ACJ76H_05715 [Bacteriovoracaceae bacterium]